MFGLGTTEGDAVFTLISVWLKPYWDLCDYHVSLRYEDAGGGSPVTITKEGTLALPGDYAPEDALLALGRLLVQQGAEGRRGRDAHALDTL